VWAVSNRVRSRSVGVVISASYRVSINITISSQWESYAHSLTFDNAAVLSVGSEAICLDEVAIGRTRWRGDGNSEKGSNNDKSLDHHENCYVKILF
jgi:hypothetical protein